MLPSRVAQSYTSNEQRVANLEHMPQICIPPVPLYTGIRIFTSPAKSRIFRLLVYLARICAFSSVVVGSTMIRFGYSYTYTYNIESCFLGSGFVCKLPTVASKVVLFPSWKARNEVFYPGVCVHPGITDL